MTREKIDPRPISNPVLKLMTRVLKISAPHAQSSQKAQALARVHGDWLMQQVMCLPEREKWVLIRRYGLADGIERVGRVVGEEYGCTRAYIHIVEQQALKRLGAALAQRLRNQATNSTDAA